MKPLGLRPVVQGSLPLDYQWYLERRAVAGATSNVLILPSVQVADEGNYTLVVTNSYGSVTSVGCQTVVAGERCRRFTAPALMLRAVLAGGAIDPFWTW